MVITEENGTPFTEESLADQLVNQGAPTPKQVQETSRIEGIGVEIKDSKLSDLDLLDDNQDVEQHKGELPNYIVKKYNRGFILSVLWIVVFMALNYLAYLFYQYLDLKSLPELPVSKVERVQKTSDIYDEYGASLGLFDREQYLSLSLSQAGEEGARRILKDDQLNFVQKKDLLEVALKKMGEEIVELRKESKTLRESLNKDGFFPQELVDILKTENAVGSIQRSLLSLEVVKFSSAMKVFSLMDVFISSIADNLGYTKSDIREKLTHLITRGERDVEYYLNVCYNNPYEPVKCDKVDDFNTYYKRILGDKEFDTGFFKVLMEFINNNLEYSNMPSFAITFNSFDGKSNSIGFTVEVNTLKEDEYALIQQGIKSPHIFIVSELIKLLKQSTFIVGKAIDAKDVKVTPKQITIGGSKYVVNNSIKNFSLPIQKGTEREIFDFLESYSSTLKHYDEEQEQKETQLLEWENEDKVSSNSERSEGQEPAGFITDLWD